MRFIFSCGGTAGHINPAIGVAQNIKRLIPEAEILFIGAEGMMETRLVPREGFEIKTVPTGNLSRSISLNGLRHNLSTVKKVLRGTGLAKKIIAGFKPDVVIGTGGYVCYPVLKAAHSLGVPTLVHESNAVPGLTTKLVSRFADCVMVGFEGAAENYSKKIRVEFTGTPVRDGFAAANREEARHKLDIPGDRALLVSVWGSLGSDHMNGVMETFAPLAAERQDFMLIHSAGKRGYAGLSAAVSDSGFGNLKARGVDIREYIYDMDTVMAAADLIMCRSGASTLGELAALGKPALLIPSPNVTNDHQGKNAGVLERLGAAEVLREGEFDASSLYEKVNGLLSDRERLDSMSRAMRSTGVPDATGRITELILSFV